MVGIPRIVGETSRRPMFCRTPRIGPPMGGVAASRRRKTPIVLSYEAERRKGRCFPQPPETGPLPRRERQQRSCSQGAVGHPLERGARARDPPTSGNRPSPVKGKTPLGLPYGGERRMGLGFANIWEQVLSLAGRDREGLPSQGTVGHPLRETERVFRRGERACSRRGGL